jgi:Zn-dependent protease
LSLALFNLLPLFPLDGAHVWGNLLPRRQAYHFARFSERYGTMLLLAMLLLPHVSTFSPLNVLIGVPRRWLTQVLLQGI